MREENGSFFTECRLENRTEICHIDTGAYGARVRAYPSFDKYPSLGKTRNKGVGGEIIESDLIHLKAIKAGQLEVYRPIVAMLPTTFPHSVLGLEFFEAQSRVTFDFPRNQIYQARFQPSCSQKFSLKNNLIHVPATMGREKIHAGWDTGASLSVVDAGFAKERTELFEFVRDLADGGDANGSPVQAKLYKLKNLSLCGRKLKDIAVVAVDFTEPKKEMADFPDLFIGANLMAGHKWSFNFKDRHWRFE